MILPRTAGDGDHDVVEGATPVSVRALAPSTAYGGPPPAIRCDARGRID